MNSIRTSMAPTQPNITVKKLGQEQSHALPLVSQQLSFNLLFLSSLLRSVTSKFVVNFEKERDANLEPNLREKKNSREKGLAEQIECSSPWFLFLAHHGFLSTFITWLSMFTNLPMTGRTRKPSLSLLMRPPCHLLVITLFFMHGSTTTLERNSSKSCPSSRVVKSEVHPSLTRNEGTSDRIRVNYSI